MNGNSESPEVGQTIEIAIWLSGTETDEHLLRWQSETVPATLKEAEARDSIMLGPVRFSIKRPGEDRVPPVPKHIHGPDVRLLLAEAPVLAKRPPVVVIEQGLVADLTPEDLAKLRKVTRRAYAKAHPDFPPLTDRQCDQLINLAGPAAAVATLRRGATQH